MKNELQRHKLAYLILILVLMLASTLYLLVWPDRSYQRLIGLLMGIFYFLWGIIVHTKSSHLTGKIVVEYGLVSVIASLLLILITI